MDKKRIVITGLGVISSNGIGKDAFMEGIFKGVSGVKPISLFDTASFRVKTAGEIKDFNPAEFLGAKGLRTLDRSTKLVLSAVKLALDDARLVIRQENTHDIGVVLATNLGSVNSISEFDKEALLEGPQYVNPALFPNTVINSPASHISIKFNIKGFNTALSTGFSAGIDAFKYALDFLKLGRANVVLVAGVEELCVQTFLGFYKTDWLAGSASGGVEISCPFDKRRNGIVLGEGAGVLVLEDLESAVKRGADIYAEVIGFGRGFDSCNLDRYSMLGLGLKKAIRSAVREAKIAYSDIDYICSAANSTIEADLIESKIITEIFAGDAQRVRVSSIKSMIGECFSASGSLQAAAAIGAIARQMIPPTINYLQKDLDCNLNYAVNQACSCNVNKVLINAFGPGGGNSSLIIAKFK